MEEILHKDLLGYPIEGNVKKSSIPNMFSDEWNSVKDQRITWSI